MKDPLNGCRWSDSRLRPTVEMRGKCHSVALSGVIDHFRPLHVGVERGKRKVGNTGSISIWLPVGKFQP